MATTATAPHEQALTKLIDRIVNAAHPLRVILFGSAARGSMGPASDVDVLVVMPNGTHRRHAAQDIYEQLGDVGVAVDIIVATPDDLARHRDTIGLVYREALREGRELYAA